MDQSTYREVGNSRTLPEPRGKTIPILPPDDTTYLCTLICECSCNPIISSSGRKLKQRCVTVRIRNDCDAHEQVWKYKGEVGYNMKNNPPSPIMSGLKRNAPEQFPAGVDIKDLENAFELARLTGRAQRGLLRIPDVIIVKDRYDFDLSQRNIEFVVEIKFPPDKLTKYQKRAYTDIAGDPNRFKVLSPEACACKPCGKPEELPDTATLPQKLVVPDMTYELKRIREHNDLVDNGLLPGPRYPEPATLADTLATGKTEISGLAVAFTALGLLLLCAP